jgi:hypothetical protein
MDLRLDNQESFQGKANKAAELASLESIPDSLQVLELDALHPKRRDLETLERVLRGKQHLRKFLGPWWEGAKDKWALRMGRLLPNCEVGQVGFKSGAY